MNTESRKEEKSETKTEESQESCVPLLNGANVNRTEEELPLPKTPYVATIWGVVCAANMMQAIEAVKSNKGAAGVDGITTQEIERVMKTEWIKIRQVILEGKYKPKPVRRVEIPKPDGGVRQLGIPTVMDRIIQQAIYQEIVKVFDPLFSASSYGFRRGKSAHQAVLKAQNYIQEGCEWVIDIDLEKFFDRVNHDKLMARVARHIKDKDILRLIRRYLQAGAMEEGLVKATEEGTPQGGPLSPLLSNIMLDDLDKELEKRGLRFARYADDCNIYVKSEKAGKRVMEGITKYLTNKLKLKVNEKKSAVDNPWNRKFLGFTFSKDKGKIKVHESRTKRLKDKIRELTQRMRGSNLSESIKRKIMPITRGWVNYFGIAELRTVFKALDGWIRRKIRGILWRQWKKPRTRKKKLIALGLKEKTAVQCAYSSKGPWRMAKTYGMHQAVSNSIIASMGYISMTDLLRMRSQCS